MWLFQYTPVWLFQLTFFLGIVVYLVATTLKILPYSQLFKYGSIATIFLSTYLLGMQSGDASWRQKTQALQAKVLELEVKSAEENTKIVERVVTKRETIRERGQNIIQYVDRVVVKDNEVVKYVEHCPKLPAEIVNTINKAAKP
jgi:hypothetical protein